MKEKDSIQITDPLFETIDLIEDRDLESLYIELLNSFELRRAQWINQSGLLYQIYHGCTHTRRAHAIGCWCVGWYALNDIKVVKGNKNEEISLKKWLIDLGPEKNKKSLLKAFMAALLLHDIGHAPFSHALELTSLPDLKLDHGQITGSLISGEPDGQNINWKNNLEDFLIGAELKKHIGIYSSDEAIKKWQTKKTELPIVYNILKRLGTEPIIVKNIVLEPNKKEIEEKIPPDAKPINCDVYSVLHVLHLLVNSQVDIDRIDHYLRDSYFSGLRFADYRIRPFLQNLRVVPRDAEKCEEIDERRREKESPGYILIKKQGLEYMQHLRAVREFIFNRALWLETNLFLIGSLIQALRVVIKISPLLKLYLPFFTDETLLHFLKSDRFKVDPIIEGYSKIASGEVPLYNYRRFKPRPNFVPEVAQNLEHIYEKADEVNEESPMTPQILIFSNISNDHPKSPWGENVIADEDICNGYKKLKDVNGYVRFTNWISEADNIRKNNIFFWFPKKSKRNEIEGKLGISNMLTEV